MNKKSITLRYFYLAMLILLCACGTLPTEITGNVTPTINLTDVNSAAQSAASTLFAQTMAAIPTSTVIPTDTLLPPTSTQTPLPFVALEGLRVAYIIDDNLYVQDSGEQAIQLTHSGQDRSPVFSDDGQKIVFSRESESEMNQLRVIGADGIGERALVTNELLTSLDLGYDEFTESHSISFVPGTHLLLFNTHNFSAHYPKANSGHYQLNYDLMLIDTDTSEIKQMAAIGQGGFFLVSPNGKMIAVQTTDHVDVLDLQGRVVLRNLAKHSPDFDCVFYGYMCVPMYWIQNSSELILVQPIPLSEIPANRVNPLARTVWRYPLDGRPGIEIRLSISPLGETLSVSPDGKWIAYSIFDEGNGDGVYLANLRDGTSQLIYKPESNESTPTNYDGWSPDSVYFIVDNSYGTFVGNIEGETIPLGNRAFLGWIDNNHYFGGSTLSQVDSQEVVRIIDLSSGIDRSESPIAFVFVKP